MRAMRWLWTAATVIGMAASAHAQPSTLEDPAELPPASYQGQQYVDSKGCVYLRGGYNGAVTWVPRVSRDRKQICGVRPTFAVDAAPPPAEAVAPPVAEASVAPAPADPAPARRSTARRQVAAATPAPVPAPAPDAGPVASDGLRFACPAATPKLERLRVGNGERKIFCTRGDGSYDDIRLPRLVKGGRVVAHVDDVTLTGPQPDPVVPKGYVKAWPDDRLNPHRGVGTAEGDAGQDRVLTREVPATDRTAASKPTPDADPPSNPPRVVAGDVYVQVGTFGVASNAAATASRLTSLGLPVATTGAVMRGKSVRIVLAGPFDDAGAARAALGKVRKAGFPDAFLRD